jgi:gliding motility-associated-like protein
LDFGDSIQLKGQTSIPPEFVDDIYWTPEDRLSCPDCYDPWASPFETTNYTFTVVDTLGCTGSASITLTVDRRGGVYIPNGFSPNGDGTNDAFTIYGGIGVEEIVELRIFDRWGEMVYHRENFPPNDPLYGWNGIFRDQPMNAAVFAYWTRVRMIDGTIRLFKGDLTLVR